MQERLSGRSFVRIPELSARWRAYLVFIDECGHASQIEQPMECARLMHGFVGHLKARQDVESRESKKMRLFQRATRYQ